MDLAEYRSFDALGLAGLVSRGQVSAHELLDAAMEAVADRNPAVNAVVNLFDDQARMAIETGLPDGPFRGVPFAIKDLWANVAGITTSNSSRLFVAVPEVDSEIVARYRRAGLVLFAKTNTPELGVSPTTEPAMFGPTTNPWDSTYSAGGSSGGAAAAVASGIIPLAHASDGGGSIRIPASCCGLFGLKPTRARISLAPDRGEGWAGMSTQHAVARSVRDSAAALDACAGPVPGDPYWAPPPAGPYLAEVGRDPGRLRVGLVMEAPNGTAVSGPCRDAVERTALRLENLGHRVDPVGWPFDGELMARASAAIIAPSVAAAVNARLGQLGRDLKPDDLEEVTARIVEGGRSASAIDYINSATAMHQIGRTMATLFEHVDVVLTPTLPDPPLKLGMLVGTDVKRFAELTPRVTAFTTLANITGQPAMSVPLDATPAGLPIGSQVMAPFGDEATLFRLAAQLEAAHPWFDRISV
jgi:Asp-tRNA(Asn)/Glu-tRNA(Gln) amidotransferase A subunit family amidase